MSILQVMHIMAAVDIDVREAIKAGKARPSASGGSRWRRGEDGVGVQMHEQVVCSIKAHQNGTLEIAPGIMLAYAVRSRWFFVVRSFQTCFFAVPNQRTAPSTTTWRIGNLLSFS